MDYHLAKKLKEASYPQKNYFQTLCPCDSVEWKGESYVKDCRHGTNTKAYAPTLEELIEACGEDFSGIMRNKEMWQAWKLKKPVLDATGETPIIAVANLYLALQGKK